jgi:hypothetical protein
MLQKTVVSAALIKRLRRENPRDLEKNAGNEGEGFDVSA